VQEGLGWDAANVEAGTAEGGLFLDERNFQSELGRFDGSHVPAGSGTNNNKI
jgi:hypothetical protein